MQPISRKNDTQIRDVKKRRQALKKTRYLAFTVQYADEDDAVAYKTRIPRTVLIRWVKAALFTDAQITLRFVGISEARHLNRVYRGKDKATNVLTFTYPIKLSIPLRRGATAQTFSPFSQSMLISDIVLCCPIIDKEAAEQNKTIEAHYAHLIVHGTLHAQGYDHSNKEEATDMESLEVAILNKLGFPAPYEKYNDMTNRANRMNK